MFPLQFVLAASRCLGSDCWHIYQVLDISKLLLLATIVFTFLTGRRRGRVVARGHRAAGAGGVERGRGGRGGGGGRHLVIELRVIFQDISTDVAFLVTVNTGVVSGDVIF